MDASSHVHQRNQTGDCLYLHLWLALPCYSNFSLKLNEFAKPSHGAMLVEGDEAATIILISW